MKNLYAILLLVGTCCAQSTGSGRGLISGTFIDGISATEAEDIPLPDFTVVDGSPLQLPIGVNPLAYLSVGSPRRTIYIGDTAHGCPKAPGANGNSSQTYCTYSSNNPGGGAVDDFTALNAVTSAWDGTYWDVWVTHGSHFDSSTPWIWPYVAATGWLVIHSDCTEASPCTGTNDFGYNPRGRQVCSHGPMDQLTNPPLPNMGWRNHGCTGATLGFPSTGSPVPVSSAAYPLTNQTAYDDLANMWTVSSSSNGVVTGAYCAGIPSTYCSSAGGPSLGSVIQMSMGAHDSSTNCYGGYCPTDGVNHIGIQDAAVIADPASHNIIPVQIQAPEWVVNPNPSPLIQAFVNAAPHDIFLDEDYFASDADDDGFGVNFIATEAGIGCARCSLNHDYFDGIKRDGSEGHVISIAPPGPTQIIDNWVEGNSVAIWGGGGSTPAVQDANGNGLLTQNTERARNRLTYNPRWLPSPAGIQALTPTVTGWTCASGALVMTMKSTVPLGETTGGVYTPIIYVNLPGSGVTPQWYNASAFSPACASSCTATVPSVTSCTASSGTTGNIAGFAYATQNATPITVTSAAALNADTCGSSTWSSLQSPCNPLQHMNPVEKNRSETKESQAVWMDAELLENSGLDGQEGQLWSMSVRACSGVSKCGNGQTQDINDFAITNSIARHATQGMMRDARSEGGQYGCWDDATGPCTVTPTLAAVACDATYNNVIDFTFSANPNILNAQGAVQPSAYTSANGYPGASTFTGTDVYVYNAGSDLAALLPNGWYQTENIQYGATIPVFLPAGKTCTPGYAYTTQGTLFAINNGDGVGVSQGMHHAVTQNNLLYDLGNHLNWDGSGASIPSFTESSGGNDFSVNVVMGPATGTHCTSSGMATGTIGAVACAYITAIKVCAAAPYPRSGIPDCPLLLQAEVGDLMNVQCPSNTALSTGPPVTAANGGGAPNYPGARVIDLDTSGQQWFTYIPQPVSGGLPSAGTTAACPVEPPNGSWTTLSTDQGSSGLYNNNSYPKTQQFNHNTAVAMNGGRVYGASFETNLTWENSIIAVPGTGDTGLPGVGTQHCGNGGASCGFTFPGSDVYTGTPASPCTGATGSSQNSTGITNMGDPATLTFLGMAVTGRTLTNYPIWQGGAPNCSASAYAVNGNSAPAQTSTPGATVTCSGSPCSIANYSPDSIGFIGATNTNTYPLNLSDWRYYAVSCSYWTAQGLTCPTTGGIDPSSPYKAGNIFQASDGLDNGIIPAYIANAFARTLRPCLLASGCPSYYHDGPQYEWLTWKCTGTCSSFNVYQDGTLVVTTTNLYAQVYGLAVNSSHAWAVTSTNGSVSGLTSEMY